MYAEARDGGATYFHTRCAEYRARGEKDGWVHWYAGSAVAHASTRALYDVVAREGAPVRFVRRGGGESRTAEQSYEAGSLFH